MKARSTVLEKVAEAFRVADEDPDQLKIVIKP
jgi:hypothetical protein